jgi:hypothetical protein
MIMLQTGSKKQNQLVKRFTAYLLVMIMPCFERPLLTQQAWCSGCGNQSGLN